MVKDEAEDKHSVNVCALTGQGVLGDSSSASEEALWPRCLFNRLRGETHISQLDPS